MEYNIKSPLATAKDNESLVPQ